MEYRRCQPPRARFIAREDPHSKCVKCWGIAVGSPHNSFQLHTSVWEKSPPLRWGSPDSGKQRLQGLCSTTGTFLPPAERSNRGSTAVGRRTRVFQPLLSRSKEARRLEAYSGSTAFEFFPLQREVQDADDENHHVSGPRGGLVCHHRPKGCVFSHPGRSKTQEVPSVCLWREGLQYKVLPFGLALAPRTFTKCMDAALAPLRLQGIRVLNYLDDWLILAHSRELVSHHRDIVLGHIHSLGLRMNAKKSVLLPSQRTVFLGVHLQAFSVSETCMDFAPGLVKVTLRPRPGYIPKVLSTSFRSQVVTLHSFHPPPFASSEDERLHMLCPVRALKLYVDRSKVWRKSSQLLVCFGAGRRGLATSKQRISHWVRDAISLAYEARNLITH